LTHNIIFLDENMKRVDKDNREVIPTIPAVTFPKAFERIRGEKRWCSWRWAFVGDRWTKPPMQAFDEKFASVNDPETWDMLEAVQLRAKSQIGQRGVGLMLSGLPMLGVIDLDKCVDEKGELAEWAENLIYEAGSYAEVSPSRTGLKIFGFVKGRDSLSSKIKRDGHEFELFLNTNRYVCVTGEQVGKYEFLADITSLFERLAGPERERAERGERAEGIILLDPEGVKAALKESWDADDYKDWIDACYALRSYGDKGRALWDEWSARSSKFSKKRNDSEWAAADPHTIDYDTIFRRAMDRGFKNDGHWLKEDDVRLIRVPRPPSGYRVIKPVEYILDGQIPVGSLTIAGVRGGGKTTMLASLATVITGTCPPLHAMMPRVKRKVIWVTEDEDQIHRIIAAMINEGLISDEAVFDERFILIRAKRSDPKELAAALGKLGEAEGLLVNRYERGEHLAQPLIILDTVAATLEIKEENSNSDVSRAVAAVRQAIPQASVWFVTHVAKGMGRSDTLREMTARGASAFESDVQGNAVLALEDELPDQRFLILGKKRVDADKNEITATRMRWQTETAAVWGDRTERVSYVTIEATDEEERKEAVEVAAETAEERRVEAAERRIHEACQAAANSARDEGFEGLVIRGGRGGGEGPIEGYEKLKRVRIDWLRKDVCGIGSKKTEIIAGFKQTVCRLFEFNGDVEDEHCIIAIRAETFDVSGVSK
jgi:hypothetical protein